ncbi:MAG: sialidase family protein [Kiritimatiellales bacterium]
MRPLVCTIITIAFTGLLSVRAVDYSNVPGTVLDYQPLTYDAGKSAPRIFISDPEILVLSNGYYLAAHALAGRSSGSSTSGQTTVFRSTDQGASWTEIATITGILRGSLFEYDGAVYILGANNDASGNTAVIAKSTDGGTSWTKTSLTTSGPATPNNPVVFNNRIWSAVTRANYSASIHSNLMLAASWQYATGSFSYPDGLNSTDNFIGEGQIVASPDLGVFVLPKVKQYPNTALITVNTNTGTTTFDPDNDLVSLPGGEKKFGAAYDSVSDRFFVLSNPILAAHLNSGIAFDMIRNTAALLSSKDLRNWNVEKIFIYSDAVDTDGFGYMNLDFDGSNMVLVARTAFPVGSNDPRRGHDSNLFTFHTISDFRNAVPDHVLKLSGGNVLRYEKTDYEDAPLGTFALGNSFDGSALTSPNGFGKADNGDIYIREGGGRILHFDAGGNFLNTTNSSPVSFQTSELHVDQPSDGQCPWVKTASGSWGDATNWYYWGRADSRNEIAVFGSAIASESTIAADDSYTLKGLRFLTDKTCTISGTGSLALSTNGIIDVRQGDQIINLPITLEEDLTVATATGTSVTVSSVNNAGGYSLNKTGDGLLTVSNGTFFLNGGTLTVGGGIIAFTNSSYNFNGTVRFMPAASFIPTVGHSSRIVEGEIYEGLFDEISLPELEDGLGWDTSTLYSNGTITVVRKAPESWMAQYDLPTDGSADFIDSDGDGMDNYSEWKAGTNPTNALSYFAVAHNPSASDNGFQLQWNSLTGRTYQIESSTNLLDTPAFQIIRSGIQGSESITEFVDTNSPRNALKFYRITIE